MSTSRAKKFAGDAETHVRRADRARRNNDDVKFERELLASIEDLVKAVKELARDAEERPE